MKLASTKYLDTLPTEGNEHGQEPTAAEGSGGGAGTILKAKMTAEKEAAFREALAAALDTGVAILADGGASLDDVARKLDRRALRVERRPGDAKPSREERT